VSRSGVITEYFGEADPERRPRRRRSIRSSKRSAPHDQVFLARQARHRREPLEAARCNGCRAVPPWSPLRP